MLVFSKLSQMLLKFCTNFAQCLLKFRQISTKFFPDFSNFSKTKHTANVCWAVPQAGRFSETPPGFCTRPVCPLLASSCARPAGRSPRFYQLRDRAGARAGLRVQRMPHRQDLPVLVPEVEQPLARRHRHRPVPALGDLFSDGRFGIGQTLQGSFSAAAAVDRIIFTRLDRSQILQVNTCWN